MDKIIMNNMVFYGYHGVLQEEKLLGQKFYIDAELYLDLKEAGKSDDLNHTASYALVYETIEKIATKERFDLLERLGHRICGEILLGFERVETIKLMIKKPSAPVAGNFDYFGVEIKRGRQDYE